MYLHCTSLHTCTHTRHIRLYPMYMHLCWQWLLCLSPCTSSACPRRAIWLAVCTLEARQLCPRLPLSRGHCWTCHGGSWRKGNTKYTVYCIVKYSLNVLDFLLSYHIHMHYDIWYYYYNLYAALLILLLSTLILSGTWKCLSVQHQCLWCPVPRCQWVKRCNSSFSWTTHSLNPFELNNISASFPYPVLVAMLILVGESLCYVGVFEDSDVTHVEGEVDPVRDLEIISEELRLKDIQYLNKQIVSVCAHTVCIHVCTHRHMHTSVHTCTCI